MLDGRNAYVYHQDEEGHRRIELQANSLIAGITHHDVTGEMRISSGTFVSGDMGGDFNAGNFQGNGNAAIAGIGTDAVDDAGVIPGTTPHVQLGVPALLGTLTTPDGLGAVNLRPLRWDC